MRRNKDLTRVTCAGLVDADDYDVDETKALDDKGVAILPVSEIENLIVLPSVSRAILEHEGFSGTSLQSRLDEIAKQIFDLLANPTAIEDVVLRHCRRRIDRALKMIDLSNAINEADLAAEYAKSVATVNIQQVARTRRDLIQNAIKTADLTALLALYDSKGILAVAASKLKTTSKGAFESWLTRVLKNDKAPKLVAAVRAVLPKIAPR